MLPVVSQNAIVPTDLPVALREASGVAGNVSEFELQVISRVVKHLDPQCIFEIGTFDGRTTLNMAAHCGAKARVLTLDLPHDNAPVGALHAESGDRQFIELKAVRERRRFLGTDVESRITQLFGDSATFDFSPYRNAVDLVFVDGAHSYEYVVNDSNIALDLARPGAVILWHDYVGYGPAAWPGLVQALHELSADPRFRGMQHIAGTAIVFLRKPPLPKPDAQVSPRSPDSTQPEWLIADLRIELDDRSFSGQAITGTIEARNIGAASWLPSDAAIGPVRIGTRLFDRRTGQWHMSYSRSPLTFDVIHPGQTAISRFCVPSPLPGEYFLDFDLVAEHVAWFSRNGSRCASVPLHIANPV
ncbi:MAG: class I SAM-dependent methyltransferase [Pseudolabrys sp.]|nr:class I SAM-dependent methyltransferase [Pseudolabrys sp.]MDP2298083.1 class I SAM-dependent methyltransferase [Pseudolabrys sp.]